MATLYLNRQVTLNDNSNANVVTEAHSGWSTGWVAELTLDPNSPALVRAFIEPTKRELSRAGNGTKVYANIKPGFYQADSVWRSYASHRQVFEVTDALDIVTLGESTQPVLDALMQRAGRSLAGEQQRIADTKELAARDARELASRVADDIGITLPLLTGSPKQIAWACQIRTRWIVKARADGIDNERIKVRLLASTSASYWIDQRFNIG